MNRIQSASLSLLTIVLLTSGQAGAQTIWQSGTTGWYSAANWSAGVPTAGVDAQIGNGGTAQLYDAASFGQAQVRDLYLGFGGDGFLNVYDVNSHPGSLQSRVAFIGYSGAANATLSAGSSWANAGDLLVGYQNIGTMSVLSGSTVSSARGFVGDFASGTGGVFVDGIGSNWSISGILRVGNVGTGTMLIAGGGVVTNSTGYLGYQSSEPEFGSASIQGVGSSWINTGELYVARASGGTMDVTGGGLTASTNGFIGDFGGISGIATIDGSGSRWVNSGFLFVGNQGNGELNVLNGGQVSNTFGNIGRLAFAGSRGVATVSGTGSKWMNSATLTIADAGIGQLHIENGGVVSNTVGQLALSTAANGTVTVNGVGSKWTNTGNLLLGYRGVATMDITGGGAVTSADGIIGDFNTATATATISGAGSSWTNTGELRVGNQGTGTLLIQGGGAASAYSTYVGHTNSFPDIGHVIVDGPGSTFTNTFELYVGRAGKGMMSVTNGGTVANATGIIGYAPAALVSTDVVTIDGNGSSWTNDHFLFVGYESSGELRVQNGAAVSATHGALGTLPSSSGTVIIDGMGSMWTNDEEIRVGWQGVGALQVSNGGAVTSGSGVIGDAGTSSGAATVDGVGSMWTSSGEIRVGNGGLGTLTVKNGGAVSASGGLPIGANGAVFGDGTIIANVTNNGLVAPGTSPGTLSVLGNFTQNATGELQIELGPGDNYDRLDVTGHVALSGVLSLSLIDAFSPTVGQTFNILDWGSISGAFTSVLLPALSDGLSWDGISLYSIGELKVIGPDLPGDYNHDGTVDAADYVVWRKTGINGPPGYGTWRTHFGEPSGSGSGAGVNTTVPEPATLLMLMFAVAGWCVRRRSAAH